jgi:hypothetical protein
MSGLDRDSIEWLVSQLEPPGVPPAAEAEAADVPLARQTEQLRGVIERFRSLAAPAGSSHLFIRLRSSVRRRLALRAPSPAPAETVRVWGRDLARAAYLAGAVAAAFHLASLLEPAPVARLAADADALALPARMAVADAEARLAYEAAVPAPRPAPARRPADGPEAYADPGTPVAAAAEGGEEFIAGVEAVSADTGADTLLASIGARNALDLLRVEFRQRFSREDRRQVLAATGASPGREERIQVLAADVAAKVEAELAGAGDPGALALGLRALLAAGSSRNVGEHRALVRRATEVLLAALTEEEASDQVPLPLLAAITDVAVVCGGDEADTVRRHAERLARATVEVGERRPALLHRQTRLSHLADAGYVLRLAPSFGAPAPLCARARRLVLAHLHERLAVRVERPDVVAAMLYGFGDLVDRAALDARLLLWSARQLLPDYLALLHYAWGQYPLRTGWASFQDDLRYLSTLPTPVQLADASALLMTLATNFAAPGSLEILARR